MVSAALKPIGGALASITYQDRHHTLFDDVDLPVQAGRRIADITEAPPLSMPRNAFDGAVLGGGDVSERPAAVAQNDSRRLAPLRDFGDRLLELPERRARRATA